MQDGGVRTKKQLKTGTNVNGYCALGLAQNKEETSCRNMIDKGHQQNTWRSAKHYGK
jgi:hypothetical protein